MDWVRRGRRVREAAYQRSILGEGREGKGSGRGGSWSVEGEWSGVGWGGVGAGLWWGLDEARRMSGLRMEECVSGDFCDA